VLCTTNVSKALPTWCKSVRCSEAGTTSVLLALTPLIVERNNTEPAVVFDVMATRYGENRSELSPSLWSNALPDWTAPVYMTSKFATYVV
jgi:hypothetical protein